MALQKIIIIIITTGVVFLPWIAYMVHGQQDCTNFIECPDSDLRCFNNATCDFQNNSTVCECSQSFLGRYCVTLDLRVPFKDVYQHGIRFVWKNEIYLENYWVIYTNYPTDKNSKITSWEIPTNWTAEVDIGGMRSDAMEYVLCIYNFRTVGNLTDLSSKTIVNDVLNSSLVNCGIVVTAYARDGAFSLAFIGIACAIGAVVIGLLVMQTVVRCRNQNLREEILHDVMGTLNRLRHPMAKSQKRGDAEKSGQDNKTFDGSDADFSARLSGPHSDPSVRV